VTADDGDKGVYYTWVLVDIDAPRPSDPSHSPFLHYIIANLDPAGRESPVVVVSHYPVSPPFGDHRYIGLLFAQSKLADKNALSGYEAKFHDNRMNFKVSDYVERQGLAYTGRFYFYSRPAHKTS
jgi:phosphatidylethanolamine-binding protein